MPQSLSRQVMKSATRILPERTVELARRIRWLMEAEPSPWDEAAVALHQAERKARRGLEYPYYFYGLASAARTAVAAGERAFTAVELGVAGGNGLRAMERHAETIERMFPVTVSVVGVDSGSGLLEADDPRDCVFALPPGEFAMDQDRLRAALTRAELVLGDAGDTMSGFMAEGRPPIGFISCDFDIYTGTIAAFRALQGDPRRLLPRVPIYFDDLAGYPYSTEVGEWAAIRTFNDETDSRKIGHLAFLEHTLGGAARFVLWPRQFFLLHVFDHPAYNAPEKTSMPDLSLR